MGVQHLSFEEKNLASILLTKNKYVLINKVYGAIRTKIILEMPCLFPREDSR